MSIKDTFSFKTLVIIGLFLFAVKTNAIEGSLSADLIELRSTLKDFKLLRSREVVRHIAKSRLSTSLWLIIRSILHKHPQIGFDFLLNFDRIAPIPVNKMDLVIKKSDQLMLAKKFKEAASGYQLVLKNITQNKNFKSGENIHLYWSLIHSLGRSFYALKQYDEAFTLYRTIPSSYPFYKQVQFELMWNNYRNERLEYALGAISTMSSGFFTKMLDPEVYLLQYYIYRRMCRNEETELIKSKVRLFNEAISKSKLPITSWVKKDIETLVYKQILLSGDLKSQEATRLIGTLHSRMAVDLARLKKEFELVSAYLEVDSGKNKKLKPINNLLSIDQLLSTKNEKWTVEDSEIWADELGRQVFIQKELCSKEVSKK